MKTCHICKTTWEQGGWPGKLGRGRNRELHCFFSFLLRSNAPPLPCSSYPFSTICLFGLDHQVCHRHQVGTVPPPHPLGNYFPSSPCSRGAHPLPVRVCDEYDSCGGRNVDNENMPAVSHYLGVEVNMIVNLSAVSDILVKTDAEVREEASLGKLQRRTRTYIINR